MGAEEKAVREGCAPGSRARQTATCHSCAPGHSQMGAQWGFTHIGNPSTPFHSHNYYCLVLSISLCSVHTTVTWTKKKKMFMSVTVLWGNGHRK